MNERKWKEELLAQRIRDINGVPYATPQGYTVYGPLSDITAQMINDAISYLEMGRLTANAISFPGLNATIKAIASDYQGAAGANPTISCFDELWAYTSERSRRLWDEMVVPPTRKIACRLTVTYAGFQGESALLEELHKRGKDLPTVGSDLHAGGGLLMFWSNKPIAPWQDTSWLNSMKRSLRPNQFARMIENRWVSTDSAFIEMEAFDACVDATLTRRIAISRAVAVEGSRECRSCEEKSRRLRQDRCGGRSWDGMSRGGARRHQSRPATIYDRL